MQATIDAQATEDMVIAQIEQELTELALGTMEEEQGYFYSRYRELMTIA